VGGERYNVRRLMSVTETTRQVLANVPIFSGLAPAEMDFLAQHALSRTYGPGQTIFSEGDACAGLYVVVSGHVRIVKTSAGGREQVLSIDGPGSSVA